MKKRYCGKYSEFKEAIVVEKTWIGYLFTDGMSSNASDEAQEFREAKDVLVKEINSWRKSTPYYQSHQQRHIQPMQVVMGPNTASLNQYTIAMHGHVVMAVLQNLPPENTPFI